MTLHCPATVIVAACREEPFPGWRDSLWDRRVAAVYTDTRPEAVAIGAAVAVALHAVAATVSWLPVERPDALAAFEQEPHGDDGGLHALADLHRGETVLLLVRSAAPDEREFRELELGDDGVRLVR